jgi:hypothetical protein
MAALEKFRLAAVAVYLHPQPLVTGSWGSRDAVKGWQDRPAELKGARLDYPRHRVEAKAST